MKMDALVARPVIDGVVERSRPVPTRVASSLPVTTATYSPVDGGSPFWAAPVVTVPAQSSGPAVRGGYEVGREPGLRPWWEAVAMSALASASLGFAYFAGLYVRAFGDPLDDTRVWGLPLMVASVSFAVLLGTLGLVALKRLVRNEPQSHSRARWVGLAGNATAAPIVGIALGCGVDVLVFDGVVHAGVLASLVVGSVVLAKMLVRAVT